MNDPQTYAAMSNIELRRMIIAGHPFTVGERELALTVLLARAEARGYEAGVRYGHAQGSVAAGVKHPAPESP